MAIYKVAHIEKEGRVINIILMEPSFETKTIKEQQEMTVKFQQCAREAGLEGRVVPVWDTEDGGLNFFAPPYLSQFFSQIDFGYVKKRVNEELTCDE